MSVIGEQDIRMQDVATPDAGPAVVQPAAVEAAASAQPASADAPATAQPAGRPDPNARVALQAVLAQERRRSNARRALRTVLFSLVVVAAVAVIVATLLMPILQISGSSMTDTLHDQDIVVALRTTDVQSGDIIAFYYNNKILVKRVIASAGQWVDIDEDGNVFVDGQPLDEPYLAEKALGECDITLPYQVPESRIFVMGDHRSVSIDSRSTAVGCVADEQIVGKLVLCAWPFARLGVVG